MTELRNGKAFSSVCGLRSIRFGAAAMTNAEECFGFSSELLLNQPS
jgi:hypothetical protein